jgi:hypothetical protein
MATRLAPGVYVLTPTEGFSITVDSVGTGFAVIGNIDTTALPFAAGVPTRLAPEIMEGMGSVHTINIRCFFTQGATNTAEYTVVTTDDSGNTLDTITVPIVVAEALPYQTLVQLIAAVQ